MVLPHGIRVIYPPIGCKLERWQLIFVMDASARHSFRLTAGELLMAHKKILFQVLHLEYGMYVWPCAVVLAQYLWFHRGSLQEKAILEVQVPSRFQKILCSNLSLHACYWLLKYFKIRGVGGCVYVGGDLASL